MSEDATMPIYLDRKRLKDRIVENISKAVKQVCYGFIDQLIAWVLVDLKAFVLVLTNRYLNWVDIYFIVYRDVWFFCNF